jgi:hypothetical protein
LEDVFDLQGQVATSVGAMMALVDRALALNPSVARGPEPAFLPVIVARRSTGRG